MSKFLFVLAVALGTTITSKAQSAIEVGVNYTTEFLYGFENNKANWANILDVDFSRGSRFRDILSH